jgi:hypothetical protein
MKKHLATLVLAVVVGVLGFAVSGVAVAAGNEKKPSPPGQEECGHGNTSKPCKEDPQPDKGNDCEEHGNHGGVNEDHCAESETTTPDETTPDETTPTDTTPTETTPQDTVPTETTSTTPSTDASNPTSTQVTEAAPSEPVQSTPTSVESPQAAPAAKKKAAVQNEAAVLDATVEAAAPKPNRQAQQAPLTF